jgi:hypothetical protein
LRRSGFRPSLHFTHKRNKLGVPLGDRELQINFSYPLNEPSTSREVSRAVRASQRFGRNRTKLLRKFSNLSDSTLSAAVTIDPPMDDLKFRTESLTALTVSTGLPELLPRVLRLCSERNDIRVILVDGSVDELEAAHAELFSEPARLNTARSDDPELDIIVAGLMVRPGEHSLMLKWAKVRPPESADDLLGQDARVKLEMLIRDYADQWTPDRALWDQPIESARPSILTYRPATERS